tara:strand:+ start:4632 stop:7121 length:2490 start_codon:yes stop_codon:yes gene_type:complete
MRITFLEARKRMAKKFTADGVEPYPLIKNFTSHTYPLICTPDGIKEKYKLIVDHSERGHCLLKGNLIKPIKDASRAGKADRHELAYNLILDIDGLRFIKGVEAYNREAITEIAEKIIALLPAQFKDTSYIAHASASLGMKEGQTSLHIDFALKTPVPADNLKVYLQSLNMSIILFNNQLDLTASGNALKYKLDVCLADNSRIVFIAPPTFEGRENPFDDDAERFVLVEKLNSGLDLAEEIVNTNPSTVRGQLNRRVTALRDMRGLPKVNAKTRPLNLNGEQVNVLINPDKLNMTFSYERGPFVYYNINGGNSNAYYVRKENPQLVQNFKGEPIFLFEQADKTTYDKHLETHGLGEDSTIDPNVVDPATIPLVFRAQSTDTTYAALYAPSLKILTECNAAERKSCDEFMQQRGGIMPEVIPGVDYDFRPNDPRTVDLAGYFINLYMPTDLMREPPEIDEAARGIEYGYAANSLESLCPTVYKIIWSICGASALEFEHFINWLAYIINEKDKAKTAWVMHGIPGTGKGVFFDKIITPILGKQHSVMKRTENIEEQYNDWLSSALLVAVDEFNAGDSKNRNSVVNKIKNYITEDVSPVRRMRSNQKDIRNYANFIFFSNDDSPVVIAEGERRLNICPRQDIALNALHPEIDEDIRSKLPKEVKKFAAFLLLFNYSTLNAQRALENVAKTRMRESGQSSADEFISALKNKNLSYFLEVFERQPALNLSDVVQPAQTIVKRWLHKLMEHPETEQAILISDFRIVYASIIGRMDSTRMFNKLITRRNIIVERLRRNGQRKNGILINWDTADCDIPSILRHVEGDVMTAPFLKEVK